MVLAAFRCAGHRDKQGVVLLLNWALNTVESIVLLVVEIFKLLKFLNSFNYIKIIFEVSHTLSCRKVFKILGYGCPPFIHTLQILVLEQSRLLDGH